MAFNRIFSNYPKKFGPLHKSDGDQLMTLYPSRIPVNKNIDVGIFESIFNHNCPVVSQVNLHSLQYTCVHVVDLTLQFHFAAVTVDNVSQKAQCLVIITLEVWSNARNVP